MSKKVDEILKMIDDTLAQFVKCDRACGRVALTRRGDERLCSDCAEESE